MVADTSKPDQRLQQDYLNQALRKVALNLSPGPTPAILAQPSSIRDSVNYELLVGEPEQKLQDRDTCGDFMDETAGQWGSSRRPCGS